MASRSAGNLDSRPPPPLRRRRRCSLESMAAVATLPENALPAADGSGDEDEEEAEQCRIRRLRAEAGRPLCNCIRFIHDDCQIPREYSFLLLGAARFFLLLIQPCWKSTECYNPVKFVWELYGQAYNRRDTGEASQQQRHRHFLHHMLILIRGVVVSTLLQSISHAHMWLGIHSLRCLIYLDRIV